MRAIIEHWQQSEWWRPTLAEINTGESAPYYSSDQCGRPYLTRHRPPIDFNDDYSLFADDDQSWIAGAFRRFVLTCFHEAGHGVCYALSGGKVAFAAARAMGHATDGGARVRCGYVKLTSSAEATVGDQLISLASGERAADLALRKFGWWTEGRAWGVEVGARFDRSRMATARDQMGYTLTDLHDAADMALDRNWRQVATVAGVLARRTIDSGEWGYVSGEEIESPSVHMQAESADFFKSLQRLEL